MTEADALEAISKRWVDEWTARQPLVPFALQNTTLRSPTLERFATVVIGSTTPRQLTQGPIGSRRFQHRGSIVVRLHGPLDAGGRDLALLAGDVRAVLASQTIAGSAGSEPVHTSEAASAPGKLNAWYTLTLTIPFEYYDRR